LRVGDWRLGFKIYNLGYKVSDSGFRLKGFVGFRFRSCGSGVVGQESGVRGQGSGVRGQGSAGSRFQGLKFIIWCVEFKA
jgi:hypothetical protein